MSDLLCGAACLLPSALVGALAAWRWVTRPRSLPPLVGNAAAHPLPDVAARYHAVYPAERRN